MAEDIVTCVVVIVFFTGYATLLRMGKGISLIAGIKNVPEEEREKTAKGFSKIICTEFHYNLSSFYDFFDP